MTVAAAKARAMEALLTGPMPVEKVEGAGVYLLKAEGLPIITTKGEGGGFVHKLIETDLLPEQIRAARQRGLNAALKWHRREPVKSWKGLIDALECPFELDAAAEYLRGIINRMKTVQGMGGH